jgi:formylmethanofuran dehydrogenase subunit E
MKSELKPLLEEAEAFHSHLGPFLVLGLKAGLLALRELKAKRGDSRLSAQVELPYRVPISCLLDGVQFSTGCTIGNKRLSFKDSTDVTLTFAKSGEGVGLTLKEAPFQLLSRLFRGEHLNEKELSNLAHNVAIMNEKELFEVREQAAESMRVRI